MRDRHVSIASRHRTPSHPGCPRQSCQLVPEPHQSPIRIKASERAPWGSAPAPGTSCPRQPSVPGRVHHRYAQDVWLPVGWRQPHHGSPPRRLSPHARGEGDTGVKTAANRECGVIPNPFASSQPHPQSSASTRRRGAGRTAPARATCDNRRGRVYAPRLSAPPGDASVPACADSRSESPSHSEWRSGRLQ
jgi:hypothetical protein